MFLSKNNTRFINNSIFTKFWYKTIFDWLILYQNLLKIQVFMNLLNFLLENFYKICNKWKIWKKFSFSYICFMEKSLKIILHIVLVVQHQIYIHYKCRFHHQFQWIMESYRNLTSSILSFDFWLINNSLINWLL